MAKVDFSRIAETVYRNLPALARRGVQVMLQVNAEAVTVELAMFKGKLRTFSMVAFRHDEEKKALFLAGAVRDLIAYDDTFAELVKLIDRYNNEFAF